MTTYFHRMRRRSTVRTDASNADATGVDRGMTLPEVLITMVIMGTLLTAMVASTTVILRQQANSSGRLNNARSEQNVGVWLPSDLASAETVDTSPLASPCGAVCPPNVNVGGSNALMLTWTGSVPGATEAIPTLTTVSYRYVQVGTEFQIIRVACLSVGGASPTCNQVTVLHDVPAPPAGQTWIPGTTSPTWVMVVRLALDPSLVAGGPDETTPVDPTYYTKNGRRVTVTINGGGNAAGAGGGQDQITLTAGGTDRKPDLSTSNFSDPPSFSATRSRCGGNFGMIVDTSGSIGSTNMTSVKTGITAFVNSFAGTPIKLQVVRFSSTATTLGAAGGSDGWTRYYDMLVDSDVADLKAQVGTLTSTGSTNYEDAMFRMFKNSDGTVQSVLPDTLIFFTDGIPNYSRLNATSASAPVVANNDDSGLPSGTGSGFSQVAWNRADRIARDYYADVDRFIGVFVGTDTASSSTWYTQGSGYHLENFLRGYRNTWDRGYHVDNVQRGYHATYEYAASGLTYQYAGSGLTYQVAGSGLTFEYANAGLTWEKKGSGSTWSSITKAAYDTSNTTNDSTDNYRVRVTGTLGSWTSTTRTLYDGTNTTADSTDGYRVRVTGTPGTWTSTTKALYDLSNTLADSTDGYRTVAGTLGTWTSTTKAYYDLNNTIAGQTDGFRTTTGTPGSWTATTLAYYTLNNTTTDSTDGYRTTVVYSSPYDTWEASTEALYMTNNTTSDNTDGWTGTLAYTAPFTQWASTTQASYNGSNSTPDATDGWRINTLYSSPYTGWEATTQALYLANNTTSTNSDGWDATKVYTQPYDYHENATTSTKANTEILSLLVSEGAPVPAIPTGGPYTNAAVADQYILPNWNQFAGALNAMALAECGGTVTIQTKVGTASAADPFTYQNSVDKTVATTSSQYRSGTFDFDLSGGRNVTADITPLDNSGLTKYAPVSWACTSAGANYPFTATPIGAGSPWSKITLTVTPNTAISCVQTVRLK